MKYLYRIARWLLSKDLNNLLQVIQAQEAEITRLKETKAVVVPHLPREVFNRFRDKFERPIVTSTTTDVQAGSLVGIQRVLTELERDHVA